MPDKRRHRGAHPDDPRLFAADQLPTLRAAVSDLSWLLSHRYAEKSALTLVGNRYQLTERQRRAVMRCACSDESRQRRADHRVEPEQLRGRPLQLDGYNVLTSVEAALAGGALFLGRDGCIRDVASMHGSYRKVHETVPAAALVGQTLAGLGVTEVTWLLDQPVSNSGRLKTLLQTIASHHDWRWQVQLVLSPDYELIHASAPASGSDLRIVATADSVILDRCAAWFNLANAVIIEHVPGAWLIDLSVA